MLKVAMLVLLTGCSAAPLATTAPWDMAGPRFYYDVAPIVIANCVPCHTGATPPRLSQADGADNGANFDALHAIVDAQAMDEMVAKYISVPRDAEVFDAWRSSGAQR